MSVLEEKPVQTVVVIYGRLPLTRKTLRKYKHVTGELGKRMAEKIDQKTGDICPHGEENRCEFLNEDNLCDIVAETW